MGAYQRTIWPNGLPPLLRRAGDQRQYEALRAFYMDGLSSSVKVRGGTADPSGSSNRIANSPMLGQFRSVEIQASRRATTGGAFGDQPKNASRGARCNARLFVLFWRGFAA